MKLAALQADVDHLGGSFVREHEPTRAREILGRLAAIFAFALYVAVTAAAWWGALQLLPTHLAFTLLGHPFDTDAVHEHVNNVMLIFLLLPSALWIECLVAGWRRSSARQLLLERTDSLKTDLACFFFGQAHVLDIVGRLMMLGASMVSGGWIHDWLTARTGVSIGLGATPLAAQALVYFAVYTFFDYWAHRFDHSRYLWPLHRYHHSATDFGVITTVRQHPAAFTGIFVVNLPMAILGAPPAAMLYVNVLVVMIGFLIHSKIDSEWGWFGRWVIQSPNNHRLHHKLDMSHPTGHFGIAPIWDRLFGTYHGEASATLPIGVDTPYRHGFFIPRDMLRDYMHFWLGLIGRRNDGPQSDLRFMGKSRLPAEMQAAE